MLDYLGLEDELDETDRMIRDTAREFLQTEVAEDIGELWIDGTLPENLMPAMGELGFFGANLDGYGLPNISERAYGLLMGELGACDAGLRSAVSVQGTLVMYPIHAYGSDDHKEEWLPGLRDGTTIGCFGLTEPAHGSNPAAMETTAERVGDEYVLSGTKTWITNAPMADVAIIWARDRSATDDPIRGFIVETDRDGVTIDEITGKLSLRTSPTGSIALDQVHIPADSVLPGVSGMKGPLSCLTPARFGIAWGALGAARDCFEVAREYACDREQFGSPIARFQIQQEKLAEMATQITTAQLLAFRLAELKERGELRPQQVSMAKRNNVQMARDQARVAREILGGNGITADYSPMRHLANMETVSTYEGTHDIHTLILGEDLTGFSAFQAET